MAPLGIVFLLFGAIGFTLVLAVLLEKPGSSDAANFTSGIGTVLLLWGLAVFSQQRLFARTLRKSRYLAGQDCTLALGPDGVRETTPDRESFNRWSAFQGVEEMRDFVFLRHDNAYFVPIPNRAFATDDERRSFIAVARERIAGSVAPPAQATDSGAPHIERVLGAASRLAPASRRWRGRLNALVRNALKIAFLLRVPEDDLATTWGKIAGAMVATLIAPTLYALVSIGSNGTVEVWGLPGTVFHFSLILACAVVVGYLVGRPGAVPVLVYASLLGWCVVDVATVLAYVASSAGPRGGPAYHELFAYVPAAWFAFIVGRFAITLVPFPAPRQGWVLAACTLLLAIPLGSVDRERSLWTRDYSGERDGAGTGRSASLAVGSEDAFYLQPKLLERELAGIKPGRKGIVDLYFVGMAGYGSQDVFMREVDAVAKLFTDRFGAEGRVVKLVNNPKTIMSGPIASASSLRAVLKKIGQTMDREEDVLFLFLTSHGSSKHEFSLELWPLRFNELTPAVLRSILDESGITNRVIVVSACYSGGFVDQLKSDNTLVIAAAAPDKNSFGCSNENDWTYFGKAYFDEALRQTNSFVEAFESAKPVILARETKEKFEPSDPRMAIGEAIKPVLARLEQQLGTAMATDVAPASPMEGGKGPDALDVYVNLVFDPSYVRAYYDTCRQNMVLGGPDRTVERTPGMFGGLDKRSPLWPRLVAAWERYSEDLCSRSTDAEWLRAAYRRQVDAVMGDSDLSPVIRFLTSDAGRSWHSKEKAVALGQAEELAKFQRDTGAALYQRYRKEEEKVLMEYRKGNGTGR